MSSSYLYTTYASELLAMVGSRSGSCEDEFTTDPIGRSVKMAGMALSETGKTVGWEISSFFFFVEMVYMEIWK